jgi:LysR family glycine cleavage system transcriptional activator
VRTLPSLSSLRAFEVAARHHSFKKAAEELHVTPTAVSHQIRGLEEAIGIPLFSRRARQVELTAAGRRLFPVLRDSFEAIARAIDVITQPGRQEVMTLTATLAFTAKWLVPRLGSAPVALRFLASDDVVDLDAGDADLAIRYGRGPYRRLDATALIVDRFAVVASPRLDVRTYADLVRLPRIEFDWRMPDVSTPTWARWARRARRVLPRARAKDRAGSTLRFSDESHAIQAAIAGHGVALLSLTLVTEELRTRLLEIPFGPIIDGPTYHLVHTRKRPLSPAAREVKVWLLEEGRATRDELARLRSRNVSSSAFQARR